MNGMYVHQSGKESKMSSYTIALFIESSPWIARVLLIATARPRLENVD